MNDQTPQTPTTPDGAASVLTEVLERMRAMADNAYCDYFSEAELNAHCAAAEKLGRHRALHEAANMLAEVLRSNA